MSNITVVQIGELIKQSDNGRITRELLQAFLENPSGFVRKADYSVTIDYRRSLEQMIKAGRYDWKNSNITSKNFPVTGTGQAEARLRLVHFNREATTKEVEDHLDSLGLKPAKIEHLLAFGEKYPDLQLEFPIVAFGSVWVNVDGFPFVPYLSRFGAERVLGLGWFDPGDRWSDGCRFLAVSK